MSKEIIKLPATIEEAMELATKVLEAENSNFENTRKLIMSSFKHPAERLSIEEKIIVRLLIIDATYSTQMGRRLFGLQDLAHEIFTTCPENSYNDISSFDKKFKELLEDYCEYKEVNEHPIKRLFSKKYGIRKNGEEVGLARSLISKYCYYASDYNFPIEDSLVRNNINSVLKYFNKIENKKEKFPNYKRSDDLVKDLIKLCTDKGYSFDQLDHLVWGYGKLAKGSLSIFVSKPNFISIVNNFKNSVSEDETEETIDKLIKNNLKKTDKLNQLKDSELITPDLYTFINLCNKIK